MSKHLADHRAAPQGGRLTHYLRIARQESDAIWKRLLRQPAMRGDANRRVVEFVRIDRGRQT